jgi:hypothetical protein
VLLPKENRFLNTQSDPKFGLRGGGVNYIDARKNDSGTLFELASFWERTFGMAFRHKSTSDSVQ